MKPSIKFLLTVVLGYNIVLGIYASGMFFINGKTLNSDLEFYSALKMTLWLTLWISVCLGVIMRKHIMRWYYTRHSKKDDPERRAQQRKKEVNASP